jgi:hypothetical protein
LLRAARGLNGAALLALLLLCLSFGLGDVVDERLLLVLRVVLWSTIGLGLACAAVSRIGPPRFVTFPFALWLAVLTLSALLAPTHRDQALSTLVRPLSGALLAWAVYACTAASSRLHAVCTALALGGATIAILGLAALWLPAVGDSLAALHDTAVPVADVPRLAAALSHPNVAAIVLELTLPLLLALALAAPRWRLLSGSLVLAQLAALILTFSRAGILAGSLALALFAALAARRGRRQVLAPVGVAALVGPIGLALAGGVLPQVERRLVAEMQRDGYQATYAAPVTVAAAPEQVLDVPVRVTNASSSEWSALDDSRVALGYHLLHTDGTPIAFDGPATLLPTDVPPNSSLDVIARVHAPPVAGAYLVEWDALREGVAWFSWRGSPTVAMNLLVVPSPPRAVALPTDAPVVLPRPSRVQYWTAALGMLRDEPLLGVGPDNFRVRFDEYSGMDEAHVGTHAHSLYLESLADTGVLGFAAFAGVLLCLGRACIRALGEPFEANWLLRAALVASLAAWLVHGVLDDFERFWPAHVAFWIVVGLLVRASQRAHRVE